MSRADGYPENASNDGCMFTIVTTANTDKIPSMT
jgi:hypothetical protein